MAQFPAKKPGRKAARYGIPVAVAGAAALTVGLVPALASAGSPDLPKISAQRLLAKMAASHTKHMSGTVKVSTDLGLPQLPGAGGGQGAGQHGGGPFGGGEHGTSDGKAGGKNDGKAGGESGASAADPQKKLMELASGQHTLRVTADGPQKQRVSIIEDAAEYSYIHRGDEAWAYDSGSNSAVHTTLPKHAGHQRLSAHQGGARGELGGGPAGLTPQKAAEQALKAVGDSTSVSVDGTQKVAGRDAYQLVIKPKKRGDSTIAAIRTAVDARTGTPLRFTVDAADGGKPVVDATYTKVDFGKPSAGSFDFKPPKGTKVTERKPGAQPPKAPNGARKGGKGAQHPGAHGLSGMPGLNTLGSDWGTVARIKPPKDAGAPGAHHKRAGAPEHGPAQSGKLLDGFADKVKGDFGTGHLVHTRLVNALITDDGAVYAGAVTKHGLIEAADADAK